MEKSEAERLLSDPTTKTNAKKTPIVEESDHIEQKVVKILPLWKKIVFGVGNLGRGIMNSVQAFFMTAYLLEVVNLPAFNAAALVFTKQAYDAVTDPIVGFLSDHTKTRFGRRKPWVILGAIPLGIIWLALWFSPWGWITDDLSSEVKTAYYLALILLFSTTKTAVSVPYMALIPEAAPTYNERTSVVMWMEIWSTAAGMSATAMWSALITLFPDDEKVDGKTEDNLNMGYAVAAVITTPLIVGTSVVGVLVVSEAKVAKVADAGVSFFRAAYNRIKQFGHGIVVTLTFPPFIVVALLYLLAMLAPQTMATNFYLYMKYVIKEEKHASWVILIMQGCSAASFFIWYYVSKKIGKIKTFIIGALISISTGIGLFFVQEGQLEIIGVIIAIRGISSGVSHLLPFSMLPDVIELYYGIHKDAVKQEGLFYSILLVLWKIASASAQAISTAVLGAAGYENPDDESDEEVVDFYQPESVITTLRILVCTVPICYLVVAIFCGSLYPLVVSHTRKKHFFFEEPSPTLSVPEAEADDDLNPLTI